MLPECRQEDYLYSVPQLDLTPADTEPFLNELQALHEEFKECFLLSETRHHVFDYSIGQFSSLERKSIEPMAMGVEGGNVRALQRAMSEASWDEERFLKIYHGLVAEDFGEEQGAVVFDESGFVKKGKDSSEVSRQYCGSLGKVENCQVGVYASYVSSKGYPFLDKRLFLPECWFSEEDQERWKKCRIPKEMEFRTKPQLASEMLQEIHEEGRVPFKYILADSVYGQSPDFTEAAEKLPGTVYFVGLSSETRFWLKPPPTEEHEYTYKGQIRSKRVLKNKTDSPRTALEFAKSLNDFFWYRRRVSEGTKGPIDYEFTKRRVRLAKDGLPDKTLWLVIRRTLGREPEYSFYLSNAPVSTKLATFVWLSGLRWAIEQGLEEAKSELGMDQ